ncbi:patatin-like phospholipase family protein [Vibrio gallicus]|uniref:patatin-like phospholipase family protein n=1 Tax=Vibrio gallicus TaxID=190897 RepID=UPI0021C4491C|nr:patatin-like phospholipase family protein [Vibrio gallicus]
MNNSGLVWGTDSLYNPDIFSEYIGGKTALVAQGGGQRGIFTAGVLDAFLYSNFDPFHTFYGTSAGAMNVCAYLCRQPTLGKSFLLELTTDNQFFNLFSFIRQKHYIGLDWALDKICHPPYKLDVDMGRRTLQGRSAFAATTRVDDFKDAYLPMLKNNWVDVLRASCAIPNLVSRAVSIDGVSYVDGGVSASIPVQEAWRKESRTIVVIRSEKPEASISEPKIAQSSINEEWYKKPIEAVQQLWKGTLDQGLKGFNELLEERISHNKLQLTQPDHETLNGGRWLFGANNIYRLAHLLGNDVDAGLVDMLMIHYQTYALTHDFISAPPSDCYVMQIVPQQPLRSSTLMSSPEDMLFDYQQGLDAGYRFVNEYQDSKQLIKTPRTVY